MNLIERFHSWRRARIVEATPIDDGLWDRLIAEIPVLGRLADADRQRLRELVALFLHHKKFFGVHDLVIDDAIRLTIAAQACLLILNHDLDGDEPYPGFTSVIVYPGAFVARHDYRDAIGVVHERVLALDGETTERGPVVVSLEDALPGAPGAHPDRNVVLHEFAHKLDFLDGTSNGHPPLHDGMSDATWSTVFIAAYEHMNRQVEHGHHSAFNPYGATAPAEFFAVMTEAFFQVPERVRHVYPEVYAQLALYYRQDPAGRTR